MATNPQNPVRKQQWVPSAELADLWATPHDPTLDKDLEMLSGEIADVQDTAHEHSDRNLPT